MSRTEVVHGLPKSLGRYHVLGLLGKGGMGTVYRGHDPHLGREVALKVPDMFGSPDERLRQAARFEREARASAQVRHPNVCPVLDVGNEAGQPFIVMSLIEGGSLASCLAKESHTVNLDRVVSWIRQLLSALAAIHAHGIVHRDLKPGNILLDADHPIITDFGLSRSFLGDINSTTENGIVGTVAYMAPEQVQGRSDMIGPWTDLYSLGVVMYQMLTGRLPFEGPVITVLNSILNEAAVPPRKYRPDLPEGLERVILRSLQKEPGDRYVDAASFSSNLSKAFEANETESHDGPADQFANTTPLTEPFRSRSSLASARIVAWISGAVLMGLAAAVESVPICEMLGGQFARVDTAVTFAFLALLMSLLACLLAFLGFYLWHYVEGYYTRAGLEHWIRKGAELDVERTAAAGVPLDLPDSTGVTPLMKAVSLGQSGVVDVLLKHGADASAKNVFGQTAQDLAAANGRHDLVQKLSTYREQRPFPTSRRAVARFRPVFAICLSSAIGALCVGWLLMQSSPHTVTLERMMALHARAEVDQVYLGDDSYFHTTLLEPTTRKPARHGVGEARICAGPIADPESLRKELEWKFLIGREPPFGRRWPGNWALPTLMVLAALIFGGLGWILIQFPNVAPFFVRNAKPPGMT